MINKAINWHRIVLEKIVPVYDSEGNWLYDLYYYRHYYHNYFFDNDRKKAATMRRDKQEITKYEKYQWAERKNGGGDD